MNFPFTFAYYPTGDELLRNGTGSGRHALLPTSTSPVKVKGMQLPFKGCDYLLRDAITLYFRTLSDLQPPVVLHAVQGGEDA